MSEKRGGSVELGRAALGRGVAGLPMVGQRWRGAKAPRLQRRRHTAKWAYEH
jgi:hypothetical protein